jgi:hypothetical protein
VTVLDLTLEGYLSILHVDIDFAWIELPIDCHPVTDILEDPIITSLVPYWTNSAEGAWGKPELGIGIGDVTFKFFSSIPFVSQMGLIVAL